MHTHTHNLIEWYVDRVFATTYGKKIPINDYIKKKLSLQFAHTLHSIPMKMELASDRQKKNEKDRQRERE